MRLRSLIAKLKLRQRVVHFKDALVYYIAGIYHRTDKHHIFLSASGISFSLILCAIPLVLVVFSVLGFVLSSPDIKEQIRLLIARAIPYRDYANFVEDLVFTRVAEFRIYKSVAGIFGLVGLFFASSGLFGAMRTVLNQVFRIYSDTSAIMGKLRDFGLILLVLVYFLVSTTVLPSLEVIWEFAHKHDILQEFGFGFVEQYFIAGVSFLLIFGAFFIIYYTVPHRRLRKRVVAVSALSASILWVISQQVFGFYLSHFVTLKRIYGAYVLLIASALWVYYSSLIFILAAEIGQLYRERSRARVK